MRVPGRCPEPPGLCQPHHLDHDLREYPSCTSNPDSSPPASRGSAWSSHRHPNRHKSGLLSPRHLSPAFPRERGLNTCVSAPLSVRDRQPRWNPRRCCEDRMGQRCRVRGRASALSAPARATLASAQTGASSPPLIPQSSALNSAQCTPRPLPSVKPHFYPDGLECSRTVPPILLQG